MQKRKTLSVHDINHAAFLLSRGRKIEKITRDGPTVCWHFDDDHNLAAEDIRNFINGDAWGDCKKFSEAFKTLKQTLRR